jgi:hypothetical protein
MKTQNLELHVFSGSPPLVGLPTTNREKKARAIFEEFSRNHPQKLFERFRRNLTAIAKEYRYVFFITDHVPSDLVANLAASSHMNLVIIDDRPSSSLFAGLFEYFHSTVWLATDIKVASKWKPPFKPIRMIRNYDTALLARKIKGEEKKRKEKSPPDGWRFLQSIRP